MNTLEGVFDEIIKHLERKKAKPDYESDGKPVKPKIEVEDCLKEHCYAMLIVHYNYYYMTVTYRPEKLNPYEVYIETQCVFGRSRQELGTKFWQDTWYEQKDVIEYIRYKLRDNK